METIFAILQVVFSVITIFLVLMHSGKDSGLSGAFGVGSGHGPLGGGSMVERNLNRWTVFFAVLFFLNAIILLKSWPKRTFISASAGAVRVVLNPPRAPGDLRARPRRAPSSRSRISIASARSVAVDRGVVLARELAGAVVELGVANLAVLGLARRLELVARIVASAARCDGVAGAAPCARARAAAR